MCKSKLSELDYSIELDQEWVLPENLRRDGEAGKGALGHFKSFADGTDTLSAQPHAVLDSDYAETYAKCLVSHLRRRRVDLSGEVLDAGCALGMITDGIRKALGGESRVHGVDLVPDVIKGAQRLHPDCHFRALSADDLEGFPDEYFSCIHLREFYPFTRSARPGFHMRFLEAMFPKLRPGGVVIAVQIVDQRGLADTFSEVTSLCREVGYQSFFRDVSVPLRLYRKWGSRVHSPPIYWAVSAAGNALEAFARSKVTYVYGFQK